MTDNSWGFKVMNFSLECTHACIFIRQFRMCLCLCECLSLYLGSLRKFGVLASVTLPLDSRLERDFAWLSVGQNKFLSVICQFCRRCCTEMLEEWVQEWLLAPGCQEPARNKQRLKIKRSSWFHPSNVFSMTFNPLIKYDETREKWQDCHYCCCCWCCCCFWWIPFGLGRDVATRVLISPFSISISIGPTDQMSCLSSKLRALVSTPRWMKNRQANNNISGGTSIRKLTADELFMRDLIRHLHCQLREKEDALAWSDIIKLELASVRTCFAGGITEDENSLEEDLWKRKRDELITDSDFLPNSFTSRLKL